MRHRPPIDLVLADCLALAALLVSFHFSENAVLRAALAGPLVLVVPGYALCTALLPGRAAGRSELLLLSVGLSLAACALGGVLLTLTPWGLRAESWATFLCALTLVASLIAFFRRRPLPTTDLAESLHMGGSVRQSVLLGMSVILAGGALWLARTPPPQQTTQVYSVLWAVPAPDQPGAIRVGVNSGEAQSQDYEVRIVSGAQQLTRYEIRLAPAGVWEQQVPLPAVDGPTVEVQLYRADTPDVIYRRVAVQAGA